jgi:hypothetical protein
MSSYERQHKWVSKLVIMVTLTLQEDGMSRDRCAEWLMLSCPTGNLHAPRRHLGCSCNILRLERPHGLKRIHLCTRVSAAACPLDVAVVLSGGGTAKCMCKGVYITPEHSCCKLAANGNNLFGILEVPILTSSLTASRTGT